MLLVHQAGHVKVGEVVRFTLTYTPANDRILPTPSNLYVKIKNSSAIPLRAAWVHGPYALHVSAYPESFNPYSRNEHPEQNGAPQFEPMLKAGGSWQAKLLVPDDIRETGSDLGKRRHSTQSREGEEKDEKGSVTWIIEVASQILFSNSASVNFEVLVGRDERSLDLGFAAVAGHGHGGPGQTPSFTTERERKRARQKGNTQTAGVYSKAVRLQVEDTEVLWDKPPLPTWDNIDGHARKVAESEGRTEDEKTSEQKPRKRKKVHLVILTHGMHSNIGADMLFLKESIDATVKQARIDSQKRKASYRANGKGGKQSSGPSDTAHAEQHDDADTKGETATAPLSGGQEEMQDTQYDSDDDEEVIVRGFSDNAVRTENGIQYLGKRLAKYILRFTYPDQPFLPVKKPFARQLTDTFKSEENKAKRDGMPSHTGSSIHHPGSSKAAEDLPYQFTCISFVGHSLGGLIQTYAMAYIHKHSPTFFTHIKPINFIAMASPMLGLSNENPMYVKFALDFGLVGRTGQDLGLTWRAPTLARGGWNAMIGGLGSGEREDRKDDDPTSKPLLRILPTGPAHQVLRMFRNRTVYSNVVNDGIVPLRTSCLLFLDWRGLGKVDKARRENGLIGTVAEWGWNELTGQNQSSLPERAIAERQSMGDEDGDNEHVRQGEGDAVPQPDEDETSVDAKRLTTRPSYDEETAAEGSSMSGSTAKQPPQDTGMWDAFLGFFRPNTQERAISPKPTKSMKTTKAIRRGQTISQDESEGTEQSGTTSNPTMRPHLHTHHEDGKRPKASRGGSLVNGESGDAHAPPKTSIFESAGDILHPPLPSKNWINEPSTRARTIFHDRVYHPEDIPPPPMKRRPSSRFTRTFTGDTSQRSSQSSGVSLQSQDSVDLSGMKVEEKIARAYHRDLSWRKVLVRLEPDAHNNIIVRRMFANAYGWPVVKHLCDTHFADTHAAKTRDEYEPARERAKPMTEPMPESGEEVAEQTDRVVPERTKSETREARDELATLEVVHDGTAGSFSSKTIKALSRQSSGEWDPAFFEGSDGDDSDVDERNFVSKMINPMAVKKPEQVHQRPGSAKSNGAPTSPRTPTAPYTDGHRGLAPTSPTASKSPASPRSAASTKSTFDSASVDPVVASKIVEEPEALGSTTELGLRKSVNEQVSPSKARTAMGRKSHLLDE